MSEKLTRDQVVDIIQKGKGLMPGFAFFSDVEREALMGYLYGSTEYDISNVDLAQIVKTNEEKVLPYQHDGYHRFLDANGYPGIKPPWGTLSAIDLNAGEIVWQVPLGEYPELTEKGIPLTGTENYGGPVLTAGGLIFIGSTHDEMFRAFDAQTGEVLWKTKLPAAGYATPCTYEIDGKQYVVIAAGGGRAGTKTRDVYVAFALPDGS
jgi:quinoprotein glucose dehydrogenase